LNARIAILGTFDADPPVLFNLDIVRYLAALDCAPSTIVFKTGSAPRPGLPLNVPVNAGPDRSVVQVGDFSSPVVANVLAQSRTDLIVYAGGRDLLRREVLAAARLGVIGGHYGELPFIRGMGTVEWSVLEEKRIVVAIQRLAAGVDAGDVLVQCQVPLDRADTFASIRERCYYITKVLLAIAARGLLTGSLRPKPQRIEDGSQFYRMHADVQQVAERLLREMLQKYR
jgi:methionyl-tRNA formyltransferase